MQTCTGDRNLHISHDEIVYEGGIHDSCPACEAIKERDEATKERDMFRADIARLQPLIKTQAETIDELNAKIEKFSWAFEPVETPKTTP